MSGLCHVNVVCQLFALFLGDKAVVDLTSLIYEISMTLTAGH